MRSTVQFETAGDALAYLFLAAKEDPAFREQLFGILRLPEEVRGSVVAGAVQEMTLRGEPREAVTAFAMLASQEVASRALAALRDGAGRS